MQNVWGGGAWLIPLAAEAPDQKAFHWSEGESQGFLLVSQAEGFAEENP